MAATDYYTLYRSKTDAELDAAIVALEKQLDAAFTSQTVGSKSYTRDMNIVKDRLQAAAYIKSERTSDATGIDPHSGVVDYSGVWV